MSVAEDNAPRGFVPKADLFKALAEIDRLKEELAALRRSTKARTRNSQIIALMVRLKITPMQSRLLLHLLDGQWHAADDVVAAVGCLGRNVMHAQMCLAKQAMKRAGAPVAIKSERGKAYQMQPALSAWLREQMTAEGVG